MNYPEITVYARNIETADGKKFTAYETSDKHGNKVNIAFALKGMPAIAADNCPCRIKLIEATVTSANISLQCEYGGMKLLIRPSALHARICPTYSTNYVTL